MVDQAPPDWRAEKVWGSPARAACRGLEPACLAASARVRCSLAYPGSLDRSQLQPEAPLACRKPIPSSVVGQYTSCDTVMSMCVPQCPEWLCSWGQDDCCSSQKAERLAVSVCLLQRVDRELAFHLSNYCTVCRVLLSLMTRDLFFHRNTQGAWSGSRNPRI